MLEKTITLMISDNYKDRFVAEYVQLKTRKDGLRNMLNKYKEGTLTFEPKCSYELLAEQLFHMNEYLSILEERARVEGVEL